MNPRTALIIQIIGDLAIPLLGYFFWNWTIFFILQFYLIENLFLVYFRHETIRNIKIKGLKKKQPKELKSLLTLLGLWLLEFILIHLLILVIQPTNSLSKAWWDFLTYQDMGIPQSLFLIPLLYFVSKMKMKQDVITWLQKASSMDEVENLKISYISNFVSIGFWCCIIGLNYIINLNEIFLLLIILILLIFRGAQRN